MGHASYFIRDDAYLYDQYVEMCLVFIVSWHFVYMTAGDIRCMDGDWVIAVYSMKISDRWEVATYKNGYQQQRQDRVKGYVGMHQSGLVFHEVTS